MPRPEGMLQPSLFKRLDSSVLRFTRLSLITAIIVGRNPPLFPPPKRDAVDFQGGFDRWESVRSASGILRQNACTREPTRGKRRFPNTAERRIGRSTRDLRSPRVDRARRISQAQTQPALVNNRTHIQSC